MSKSNGRHGNPPFARGDVVRVTARHARVMARTRRGPASDPARTGVVRRCSDYDAGVRWTGRRSDDNVPVGALELVS